MNDIKLEKTTCKRCGKQLITGSSSMFGNATKAQFSGICSTCMTNEELQDMLEAIGRAMGEKVIED